jgi:hypothetical protein
VHLRIAGGEIRAIAHCDRCGRELTGYIWGSWAAPLDEALSEHPEPFTAVFCSPECLVGFHTTAPRAS